ncbi:B-4DMT family transporter [Nocardia sp. NBC_01388]|uniref:B-4DMT family transporter n=1 Tax=Nocardia sp. NBC_01388 TaxID=2903596 RepID=UPI00324DAD63
MTQSNSNVEPAGDVRAPNRRTVRAELLMRGFGLGLMHAAARTGLGFAVAYWTPLTSLSRLVALAAVVALAVVWGAFDGRRSGAGNEHQPDDLTLFWLAAAALAAVTSGVLCWLIGQMPGTHSADGPLMFELTIGAAWILLVTFVPAIFGMALGRYLADRRRPGDGMAVELP